jgi:ABC-type sugar transport system permease subunit
MPSWLGGGAHWAGFSWTNAPLPAYTLLTLLVVWQGFPFVAVSVLAGLKTIPAELHESARVDGGGAWRIFWRVTYPLLKPIFLVLLLLSIIWDFGVFTQAYLVTGELGNRDEYNLGIYVYDRAFTMPPSYGIGSALALILTVILLIITIGYVRASVRQGRSNEAQIARGPPGRAERARRAGGAGDAVPDPVDGVDGVQAGPRDLLADAASAARPPDARNFRSVIDGKVIGLPYWNFLKNSLFVTLSSVIASMLISLLAAIAVARFKFRLRTSYLIMLLIVQMLPQQAMVIALFLDFRSLGLLDNLAGLILVYTAFSIR